MESDRNSFLFLEKLGHSLVEIRARALENLKSKVENGIINLDVNCRRFILNKLFSWFDFEECPKQNDVLLLIAKLLKEDEQPLFTSFEKETFRSIFNKLSNKINPEETPLIDEIKNIIFNLKDQNPSSSSSTIETIKLNDPILSKNLLEPQKVALERTNFPNFVFPVLPLIKTDLHILESVGISLSNAEDIDSLCETCQFFTDVILQDFSAEIFLQRSSIIKIFHNLLNTNNVNPNKTLLINILDSLNKFCKSIQQRILHFSNPGLINYKQEVDDFNEENYPCNPNPNFINEAYFNTSPNHSNPSLSDGSQGFKNVTLESQFTIEDFCLTTLEICLKHIPQTIYYIPIINSLFNLIQNLMKLFCDRVNKQIWRNTHPLAKEVINHLLRIFNLYGEILEIHSNFEFDIEFHNFIYIQLLSFIMFLINNLIPYEDACMILPSSIKFRLVEALFNPVLKNFYTPLYYCIENLAKNFNSIKEREMYGHYLNSLSIYDSMKYSIYLIKNISSCDASQLIITMNEALPSIPYHKNLQLIDSFFNYIFKNILWSKLEESKKENIITICLKLLSHTDNSIKMKTYTILHSNVISLLGVKTFDKEAMEPLVYLMNKSILVELAIHGLSSNEKQITKISHEIIIHLLKGKILMNVKLWEIFINNLIPVLPLLICHASNNTTLGKTIIGIFDPDIARSILMPEIEILKGNILLLFASDDIRKEAITRIIWILSNEENSEMKMPKLSQLDLEISSNLCIIKEPVELLKSNPSFYEESNLIDILNILNLDNQSELKYSSLLHLSTLVEDQKFHGKFLRHGGLEKIISLLEESMYIQSNNDKIISPIIIILKKLSILDPHIRQSLTGTADLYSHLIRVLFLFCGDETIKQTIPPLLFLLICSNWIILLPENVNNRKEYKLSIPFIFKSLSRPFQCHTHWKTSLHTEPCLYDILMSNNFCKKFLKIMWCFEWFGGWDVIKEWHEIPTNDSQLELKKFNSDLIITQKDLHYIRYSIIYNLIEKHLYNIQNSTNHKTVLNEITFLYGYLSLFEYKFVADFKEKMKSKLITLPWELTFSRFLKIPPNSPEDKLLVLKIIDILILYINTFFSPPENTSYKWVSDLLKNPNKPLPQLVQNCRKSVSNCLSYSVLMLAQQLALIDVHSQENILNKLISNNSNEYQNTWLGFINIIIDNLKYFNKQHFYNLALISKLLNNLMWLTKESGWSQTNENKNKSIDEFWIQLISCLKDIVIAFSCGKCNINSFMGIVIIRNAMICLNNLFMEIKYYGTQKDWESYWRSGFGITAVNNENNLEWLVSLLEYRDVIIRSSTLHLISDFSSTRESCLDILPKLNLIPGALWKISINFLLDHNEASLVREQSASLFSNLLKNITYVPLTCELKFNETRMNNYIFNILEEFNFFKEILSSISYLTFETNIFNLPQTTNQIHFNSPSEETSLTTFTSSLSLTTKNSHFTTPWFIKTLCWILNDLIEINPTLTLLHIHKFHIIQVFLRCFEPFPEIIKYKDKQLLEDTLEFYSVICEFLRNCVERDEECAQEILNNSSSAYTLLKFINLELFDNEQQVANRNCFWEEIFKLLSCLLNSNYAEQTYNCCLCAFQNLDFFSYLEAFIHLLENSSENININLFHHLALLLEFELKHISSSNNNKKESDFSFTKFLSIDIETKVKKLKPDDINFKKYKIIKKFCKILFELFEIKTLQKSNFHDDMSLIALLNHLIVLSKGCQTILSQLGLLDRIVTQFKDCQIILSLETTHMKRNAAEKKKLTLLLDKLQILFGLLTNIIYKNEKNKLKLIEMGLTNILHNLWIWIQFKKTLFITSLKLLLTFTCNSIEANQSLCFVSGTSGGITKRFSTNSIIHSLITYIIQSMHVINPPEDLQLLELSFNILKNAIHTHECRGIIVKSTLFQTLNKFFPEFTKNQKQWIKMQIIWLNFIKEFTFYPEGQLIIPKIPESMELFLYFISSNNIEIKNNALFIMRNLAFHPYNRVQLISSDDYLSLLHSLLNNGTIEEKYIATTIIWALIANNQKAKQQIKTSKLNCLLKKNHDYLILSKIDNKEYQELLEYILKILK